MNFIIYGELLVFEYLIVSLGECLVSIFGVLVYWIDLFIVIY